MYIATYGMCSIDTGADSTCYPTRIVACLAFTASMGLGIVCDHIMRTEAECPFKDVVLGVSKPADILWPVLCLALFHVFFLKALYCQ